jgi:hypothetical protein
MLIIKLAPTVTALIAVPVLYKECEIPLRLERKQHIDFRANYARGLELLLRDAPFVPQPSASARFTTATPSAVPPSASPAPSPSAPST